MRLIHYIHYPSNETRSGRLVRSLRPVYNAVELMKEDGSRVVVHHSNIIQGLIDDWAEEMLTMLSIPGNLEYVFMTRGR